ncbi:MAG TPA: hypothetical protein VGN34_15530 [Ktedonobacteraceae bacterium]|jgi:hypothetical protein
MSNFYSDPVFIDPVLTFANELAWFIEQQAMRTLGLNNELLAERAHTTKKTVSTYRANIRRLQAGVPLPLPTWDSILVLAFAARPQNSLSREYLEFMQRIEQLERSYNAAVVVRPREYGSITGEMQAVKIPPAPNAAQKIRRTVLSNK